jgi:hypothetical protein
MSLMRYTNKINTNNDNVNKSGVDDVVIDSVLLNAKWNEKSNIMVPLPKPFRMLIQPIFEPDYTVGVYGARRTGKTFLIRWLMYYIRRFFPVVYVFTKTKMNSQYGEFCNPEYIFDVQKIGFEGMYAKIREIYNDQRKKVKAFRKGAKINPYICIIYDDCISFKMKFMEDFLDMYFIGRHLCVCGIWAGQYYYAAAKSSRANMDLVFSMRQDQINQIEALYEEMMGKRCDKDYFIQMIDKYSQDQQFVCFHMADKQSNPIDRVYYGKAEDPGLYIVGSTQYWETNMNHYKAIMSGTIKERSDRKMNWVEWIEGSKEEKKKSNRKREEIHDDDMQEHVEDENGKD